MLTPNVSIPLITFFLNCMDDCTEQLVLVFAFDHIKARASISFRGICVYISGLYTATVIDSPSP